MKGIIAASACAIGSAVHPTGVGGAKHLIRLFVIGTVRLHREGLAALLTAYPGLQIVGTGEADHPGAHDPGIDILVVDVGRDPAASAVSGLAHDLGRRVVVYGVGEREQELIACVEAGAAGFALADDGVGDLVESIECAARGEVRCSSSVAAVLARRLAFLAAGESGASAESRLTARELQIIRLVDDGLSNKQIAQTLQIQVATVKNHVHSILEKLNVSRRAEAAARVRAAFRDHRADQVPVVHEVTREAEGVDLDAAGMGTRARP